MRKVAGEVDDGGTRALGILQIQRATEMAFHMPPKIQRIDDDSQSRRLVEALPARLLAPRARPESRSQAHQLLGLPHPRQAHSTRRLSGQQRR